MVARTRLESGRPVDQTITGKRVCIALHIRVEPGGLERGGGVFIMSIDHIRTRGTMEVRVVHGHLGKVRVRRTTERMWENEMKKDSLCRHEAFSSVDGGRVAGIRNGGRGEVIKKRKWISGVGRKRGGRRGGHEGLGKRLDHFRRESRVLCTQEANRLDSEPPSK